MLMQNPTVSTWGYIQLQSPLEQTHWNELDLVANTKKRPINLCLILINLFELELDLDLANRITIIYETRMKGRCK